MAKLKILYVASEIYPFLKTCEMAEFVRNLPQAMQERGLEIRILVPRFGLINERKNRLHEVVRLSGINISMGDEEKPLVIKVASIPSARMQVYFIDNEDYFQRKSVFFDNNNNFYRDNDERAVFFCKGVLETVRKLGWPPDIIHCNDWMTSLIPLYVKTTYRSDPIFHNAKCVFTVHNPALHYKVDNKKLLSKIKMINIDDHMLQPLQNSKLSALSHIGAEYADVVVGAEDSEDSHLKAIASKKKNFSFEEQNDTDYSESYYNLYHELAK